MNNWRKGIASWQIGNTLYQSIPFTWLLPEAEKQAELYKGKVVAGGPAVRLMGAPWADTTQECDYAIQFHNPLATFTTRGCPNKCSFCAVPIIEGDFRELSDWKPAPVICDNNITEASRNHFERVIESVKYFPFVDFNQGLSARLLKSWHIDAMKSLKKVKVRFAFDHVNAETEVHDAIQKCQNAGLKDIGVYCLIGFNDDPQSARHRLETVLSWGIRPNPMRFQPLNATEKNSYVGENWTDYELRKTMKYYSRLSFYEHIGYEGFGNMTYANQSTLAM